MVKLFSPWHTRGLVYGNVCFSPSIDLPEADGALWEYRPLESISGYEGPKAWYSWEPSWHSMYRSKLVRRIRGTLLTSEWLHYAHPDSRFRVPHITNCGSCNAIRGGDRLAKAVATVNNFGGRYEPFWFLRRSARLRNRFIIHPLVELYGSSRSWMTFRRWGLFSRPQPPANYKGDGSGTFLEDSFIEFLSRYKVDVCLENTTEPYYFTEKFVTAIKAGCIPVYHAHQTVRDGFLGNALWVDPAQHSFDPDRTIEAALEADLDQYQEINARWLTSEAARDTHFEGVWSQLATIFAKKLGQ